MPVDERSTPSTVCFGFTPGPLLIHTHQRFAKLIGVGTPRRFTENARNLTGLAARSGDFHVLRGALEPYGRRPLLQMALINLAEAVGAYEASGAVRNDLALRDPVNPRCQRDLALIQAKLGRAYKQVGRMREAIQAFTIGRFAVAQVIERHPYLTAWADDIVCFDQHIESVGA